MGFSSFATPPKFGEEPVVYTRVATIGLTQEIELDALACRLAEGVLDGTINKSAFPDYPLRSKYGLIGDTLWLADTLRLWSECATCTPVQTDPSFPEAQASLNALKFHQYSGASRTWTTNADPTVYTLGTRR